MTVNFIKQGTAHISMLVSVGCFFSRISVGKYEISLFPKILWLLHSWLHISYQYYCHYYFCCELWFGSHSAMLMALYLAGLSVTSGIPWIKPLLALHEILACFLYKANVLYCIVALIPTTRIILKVNEKKLLNVAVVRHRHSLGFLKYLYFTFSRFLRAFSQMNYCLLVFSPPAFFPSAYRKCLLGI